MSAGSATAAAPAAAGLAQTQQLTPASPAPAAAASSGSAATPASPSAAADSAAHTHPQLVALRKIDALSEKLQKEGKLLEALQCLEKSLILRGHIFGLDSVEVFRACKSVGEMCNYLGMTFLQQDLFDVTLELLKKAEVLTERHPAVRAVTFNNLACYYRKRGKLRTALNYCRQALGIEAKLSESRDAQSAEGLRSIDSSSTHLNMCTILSELQRHEKAIVHARIALKLLLLELFGDYENARQQDDASTGADHPPQPLAPLGPSEHELIATGLTVPAGVGPTQQERLRARLPPDRVAVLAIAYHNLAVQEEFLRRYPESLAAYEKATKVVTTHLGPEHPLVASLGESFHAAAKKYEARRTKEHAAAAAASGAAGKKSGSKTPSSAAGATKGSAAKSAAGKSKATPTTPAATSTPQAQAEDQAARDAAEEAEDREAAAAEAATE